MARAYWACALVHQPPCEACLSLSELPPLTDTNIVWSMNPFVYRNLRPATLHCNRSTGGLSQIPIRLLSLLPGSKGEQICCNLIQAFAGSDIQYEALSYTWGSPNHDHRIECDKSYLQVTTTLQDALLTLRHPDKARILWIDQLCINQEDTEERNSQVKIMHLIYKYATRTIVFLGMGQVSKLGVKLNWWTLMLDLRKAHKQGDGDVLKEFQCLFAHPYFQRAWVLLEIGMSKVKNAVVYYKGAVIPWTKLTSAGTLLGAYTTGQKYNLVQLPPSVRRHEMIMAKWLAMASNGSTYAPNFDRYGQLQNGSNKRVYSYFLLWVEPRLTEVLQDSRFCLATDPRDKVYSLLNLSSINPAKDSSAWLLSVDYSLPLADVFSRAARYCTETECSLEVLCYKEGSSSIAGLPSWVPDWTSQRLFPIHRIAFLTQYRSQFHNDIWPAKTWFPPLRSTRNQAPVASFSADGKTVALNG